MAKPDQIQDETLRALVLEARTAYLGGRATESVHRSVEALLRLMHQHPDFIALQRRPGTAARVGRVWPGLGVKVELAADQPPRAVYEPAPPCHTDSMEGRVICPRRSISPGSTGDKETRGSELFICQG
jgi:hypothetical protein